MAVASWLLGEPCVSGPGECLMCDMDLRKLQAFGLQTLLFYAFTKQLVKGEASLANSCNMADSSYIEATPRYTNTLCVPFSRNALSPRAAVTRYRNISLSLQNTFTTSSSAAAITSTEAGTQLQKVSTRQAAGNLCSLPPALLDARIPEGQCPQM